MLRVVTARGDPESVITAYFDQGSELGLRTVYESGKG